ncbi:hypothetical protein KC19_VG121900 [Ceratodon purpureus]|uniref:TF-B3 domain-containing protein n=1 Tax=Ceratodon purpureus TaxID=3225 RepID=A0A8T0HPE0_CERPU|nr:hypothetical protein KC19_VG121900 [Ceratodon purpureus]
MFNPSFRSTRRPATMAEPVDSLEELVLEEVQGTPAQYFTVRIFSKTKPTRLEVPAEFSSKTGWPGVENCAIVTSTKFKEWPLRKTQLSSLTSLGFAMSDSAGWLKFLGDQDVSAGDVLVFEQVDERCLVASVAYQSGRPSVTEDVPQVINSDIPTFKKTLG